MDLERYSTSAGTGETWMFTNPPFVSWSVRLLNTGRPSRGNSVQLSDDWLVSAEHSPNPGILASRPAPDFAPDLTTMRVWQPCVVYDDGLTMQIVKVFKHSFGSNITSRLISLLNMSELERPRQIFFGLRVNYFNQITAGLEFICHGSRCWRYQAKNRKECKLSLDQLLECSMVVHEVHWALGMALKVETPEVYSRAQRLLGKESLFYSNNTSNTLKSYIESIDHLYQNSKHPQNHVKLSELSSTIKHGSYLRYHWCWSWHWQRYAPSFLNLDFPHSEVS